jgi:excisionase family DNA binding protein
MNAFPVSPWLTVREAADYLRCSVSEIHHRIKDGRLKRHYDGTRLLVLRAEIESSVQEDITPRRRRGRPISRREPIVLGV